METSRVSDGTPSFATDHARTQPPNLTVSAAAGGRAGERRVSESVKRENFPITVAGTSLVLIRRVASVCTPQLRQTQTGEGGGDESVSDNQKGDE